MKDVAEVVASLQHAAIDPDSWDDALIALTNALGGVGAHYVALDKKTGELLDQKSVNFFDEMADLYARHYHFISPRTKFLQSFGGKVCYDYMFIDDERMRGDEFYSWANTFDASYFVAAHDLGDENVTCGLGIFRNQSSGHVQGEDIELLSRLWTHIASAVQTSRALMGSTLHLHNLAESLNAVGEAALVLAADGTVFCSNEIAGNFLGEGGSMTLWEGSIKTPTVTDQRRMDALIKHALKASEQNALELPGNKIKVQSGPVGQSIEITLQPLPPTATSLYKKQGWALLLLRDLGAGESQQMMDFLDTCGLTPAETKLALQIAIGSTLIAYAKEHGVSIHTVRNQLRSVLEKTDTHRQGELIALLNRLV